MCKNPVFVLVGGVGKLAFYMEKTGYLTSIMSKGGLSMDLKVLNVKGKIIKLIEIRQILL